MKVFAISGVKNSGKTTLICGLLEAFSRMGWKVATIKHDGHDFAADVPGTDTWRHLASGAFGTAVFSSSKCMIVKKQPDLSEQELLRCFPEADLILLEGFKNSTWPKLELIRKGNSEECVCRLPWLKGIASDYTKEELLQKNRKLQEGDLPVLNLNDPDGIAAFIVDTLKDGGEL